MKCHPVRWIWGLIPIAMLSWIAVHVEADRIERDLEQRAHSALAAAGFEWASVAFSGRDGILVGTPERLSEQSEALALVRNLWGVRTAVARTSSVEERTVAALGPQRQPQIDPDTTLKSADVVLLPEMRPTSVTTAKPASDRARADDEGAPPDAQKSQDRRTTVLATAALPPTIGLPDETCSAAVRAASVSDPVRFARGAGASQSPQPGRVGPAGGGGQRLPERQADDCGPYGCPRSSTAKPVPIAAPRPRCGQLFDKERH